MCMTSLFLYHELEVAMKGVWQLGANEMLIKGKCNTREAPNPSIKIRGVELELKSKVGALLAGVSKNISHSNSFTY